MLNKLAMLGGLCFLALVPATSGAADALSSRDKEFVHKAGQAGRAEIAAGELANSRSANGDVKKFATRMVDEHGKAAAELEQIALSKGVAFPVNADAAHKKFVRKLDRAQGAEFDRLYANEAGVKDHRAAVQLFKDEAKNGKDPELRAFAEKTLPTIQDHYDMAKNLASSLGKP